jgi:hypothetical protein
MYISRRNKSKSWTLDVFSFVVVPYVNTGLNVDTVYEEHTPLYKYRTSIFYILILSLLFIRESPK